MHDISEYQNISEEEKDNRRKKARERYQHFTEEGKKRRQFNQERKQKLPEHRRNYLTIGPLYRFFSL